MSKHRRVARPRHRGGGGGGGRRRRQHFNDILHNHHGIHQRSVMRVPQVRIRSLYHQHRLVSKTVNGLSIIC